MANFNDIFNFGKSFQDSYQNWQSNIGNLFGSSQNNQLNAVSQKAQDLLKNNIATAQEALEVVIENNQNNFNQLAKTIQNNADEGLNAFKEIVASKNPREASAIVARIFQQSSEKIANDLNSLNAKVAQTNNQVFETIAKQASQNANEVSQLVSEFFKQAQSSFSNLQNSYSNSNNSYSAAPKKAESSSNSSKKAN